MLRELQPGYGRFPTFFQVIMVTIVVFLCTPPPQSLPLVPSTVEWPLVPSTVEIGCTADSERKRLHLLSKHAKRRIVNSTG
jgi:hypothetical protein